MRCGQISSLDRSSGEILQRLIVRTMYVASAASEQNSEHRSKVCENTGRQCHPVFCWCRSINLHSKARRKGLHPFN
jgi:hypothetical protein